MRMSMIGLYAMTPSECIYWLSLVPYRPARKVSLDCRCVLVVFEDVRPELNLLPRLVVNVMPEMNLPFCFLDLILTKLIDMSPTINSPFLKVNLS